MLAQFGQSDGVFQAFLGHVPAVPDDLSAGVEAVIDKDRASAMLASELDADGLVMLTDVDAVYDGWGTPQQSAIRSATPQELGAMEFAAGSMAPKVEAACAFVNATGGFAGIGTLSEASAIVDGSAGTIVRTD